MEFHCAQQSEFSELPPSGSPPISAHPSAYSPAAAVPVLPYSPMPQQAVVYYPSHDAAGYPVPLAAGPAPGLPPVQHSFLQPADAYQQHQYYFHAAATAHPHRQSPDALSANLSPPPAPLCYAYSSPPPMATSCCCTQLHYHPQPCCSPDQQQAILFHRQPPPPQFQQLPAAPMQALLTSPPSTPRKEPTLAKRSPLGFAKKAEQRHLAGSWTAQQQQQQKQQQQQQQKRRNGYMHNILYKTELCRDMQVRGACPRGRACQFAHSTVELHDPRRHPLYKTAACNDFKIRGNCPRGDMCFHVHERHIAAETTPPPAELLSTPLELSQTSPASNVLQSEANSRGATCGRGRRRRNPAAVGQLPKTVASGCDGIGNRRFDRYSDGRRSGSNGSCKLSAGGSESYRYLLKKLSAASSTATMEDIEAKMSHLHLGHNAGSASCIVAS